METVANPSGARRLLIVAALAVAALFGGAVALSSDDQSGLDRHQIGQSTGRSWS